MKKAKQRKIRYALVVRVAQVGNGLVSCFVAADEFTRRELKARGFRAGNLVFAEFTKPRNPGFHRLAHVFGTLCVEQIDAFKGLDSHEALKKLQLDAEIECEESRAIVPGLGVMRVFTAISLAFESMDETRFQRFMARAYAHIAERYWPSMSPAEIAEMVETYEPNEG